MRTIGLTGGIASGKSTVLRMFAELGAHVLDADGIYHELLKPVSAAKPAALTLAIAARFPGVLAVDGTLDRRRLGAHVFGDDAERAALEAITHPAIRREADKRVAALAGDGVELVIYDVPLLFESGLIDAMDGVIVVWVPRAIQIARVVARDGVDGAAAEARLAAQIPLDAKRRRANWVIDASRDLAATRAQVEMVWGILSQV